MRCPCCHGPAAILILGMCPNCCARCIEELRGEVARLQDDKNELVRQAWGGGGERTVDTLTE